jgi:hypothetical protein
MKHLIIRTTKHVNSCRLAPFLSTPRGVIQGPEELEIMIEEIIFFISGEKCGDGACKCVNVRKRGGCVLVCLGVKKVAGGSEGNRCSHQTRSGCKPASINGFNSKKEKGIGACQ